MKVISANSLQPSVPLATLPEQHGRHGPFKSLIPQGATPANTFLSDWETPGRLAESLFSVQQQCSQRSDFPPSLNASASCCLLLGRGNIPFIHHSTLKERSRILNITCGISSESASCIVTSWHALKTFSHLFVSIFVLHISPSVSCSFALCLPLSLCLSKRQRCTHRLRSKSV